MTYDDGMVEAVAEVVREEANLHSGDYLMSFDTACRVARAAIAAVLEWQMKQALPTAHLRMMVGQTYIPKPLSFDVMVGERAIAEIGLDEIEGAAEKLRAARP